MKAVKITKKEMKDIFKKENLNLCFPVGAKTGATVTDWNFYFYRDFANSDLKKFISIIEKKYSKKYITKPSSIGGSITVEAK